ncbi:MAG TPA: hypothetical protein VGQ86_10035 [Candidatus Limnocylindria bacterium]|nr:hypothetical protein [Candidatus Limnocylindria bacterium]
MDPNVALPLLSSLVSFAFAALVFSQWLERRRSFQLVWTLGLLWYGISAGTEFWGSAFGWSEPLYRVWYLIGALFVAAYLGMGTVYLLARTRFGYFVAVTVFVGGLFALLSQARLVREGHPAPEGAVALVIAFSTLAAAAIAVVTWRRRALVGHTTFAFLVVASLVVAALVLTARIAAPGYALDPETGVPVGTAIPEYIRVLSGPFNIAGAFTLVFGAIFSAYVFMPKRKLLRGRGLPPVIAQVYGAVAVLVNLVVSLPLAAAALARGELHSRVPATLLIALGGFIPGITSGLNRFGITWSFFLGELLGVVFIFLGFIVSTEVFSARVRVGPVTVGHEVTTP